MNGESGNLSSRSASAKRGRWWRTWAFAAVPAVALLELGAHAMQTHAEVPERDWTSARDYVAAEASPEDLVAFAPRWVDPLGRMHFGPRLATLEREARADESRFPRAFEVAIRGAHLRELSGWRRTKEQRFGGVTVTTWENPAPARILDDLVSMAGPTRMQVSYADKDCPFVRGTAQSGSLGFGPAIPGNRFVCSSGSFVGQSVVADLDYYPRRCLYAPPSAGGATRMRFSGVRFGAVLQGHHALYVEAERHKEGAPVTIRFSVDGSVIGSATHHDGDGWSGFAFDTTGLAGTTHDLVAEVTSTGERRMYCFEANTR